MNKSQLIQSLKQQGFSKQIINAFEKVERENFVPQEIKPRAYIDSAQPITKGQTISQPYTIAMMLKMLELKKSQKVLEVGSGSGYVLALISEITKSKVYGIEKIKELAEKSKQNLKDYPDVKVYNRNGNKGLPSESPFDRILISAACEYPPKTLFNQLADNGILVAPIDSQINNTQDLVAFQKKDNKYIEKQRIPGFIFVRFIEKVEK